MSTTPNGDGEDRQLPATWEEYQRARREAFEAGHSTGYGLSVVSVSARCDPYDHAKSEACRHYPITKRVPRVVEDERGTAWKIDHGEILTRSPGREAWDSSVGYRLTPERVRILADLLANPFEEVEE